MNDKIKTVFILIGKFFGLIIVVLSEAAVLMCLWEWFIVPFGVISISLAWAVGINCMSNFFRYRYSKSTEINYIDGVTTKMIFLCVGLAVGFIAHNLM